MIYCNVVRYEKVGCIMSGNNGTRLKYLTNETANRTHRQTWWDLMAGFGFPKLNSTPAVRIQFENCLRNSSDGISPPKFRRVKDGAEEDIWKRCDFPPLMGHTKPKYFSNIGWQFYLQGTVTIWLIWFGSVVSPSPLCILNSDKASWHLDLSYLPPCSSWTASCTLNLENNLLAWWAQGMNCPLWSLHCL